MIRLHAPSHPFFDHGGPLPLAHRGFSPAGLENTMAAFAAAIDLGCGYIETDVRATSDGVPVTFHDVTLDRVTDHTGPLAAQPWSRLREVRVRGQEPIPALEDVLGTWPDVRFNVDVKTMAAVGPLARAIDRTRAHDRVCVASFSDARRQAVVRRLAAPVATSAGLSVAAAFRAASSVRLPAVTAALLRPVDCLQVPARYRNVKVVTAATIARAHAIGKQVHVWTVNEPAEMHRLLDLGVDGIITDRADLLREVLIARGGWTG